MDKKQIRLENLRILRSTVKTQSGFADTVQSTSPYVSQLLAGRQPIGTNFSRRVEKAFSLEEGWMDVDHSGPPLTLVPRISAETGAFGSMIPNGQIQGPQEATFEKVGKFAFAIQVSDDSMEEIIPAGSVVIVDPSVAHHDGSIVTFQSANGIFVRQFVKNVVGEPMLKPANTQYPITSFSEIEKILGVVVEMQSRRSLRTTA
jgi:hypothetical protein